MRSRRDRLEDMVDAIDAALSVAKNGRERFLEDELLQSHAIRYIIVLGEAARHVAEDFQKLHPQIPWREITTTRNVLVHDYLGISLLTVWNILEHHLPRLKEELRQLLDASA